MNVSEFKAKYLKNPTLYHPVLVEISGSPITALILSQAIYWQGKKGTDKYWYKSDKEWTKELSINKGQVQKAKKNLKALGLIYTKRKGIPCTTHYKVQLSKIKAMIEQISDEGTSRCLKKNKNTKSIIYHDNSDEELEQIKKQIDLVSKASEYGYKVIDKESDSKHIIMKDGSTTLVIKHDNEHARYFNRDDDLDKGSVIDFIKYRNNQNLGETRKELRSQLNFKVPSYPKETITSSTGKNNQGSTNHASSEELLMNTVVVPTHLYLTEQRCIPKEIQERFKGYIRKSICYHKNVVFPLVGTQGVCGTDNRNKEYKNITGVKAIWSAKDDQAKGVVISESPIDALSFIACRPSLRMNLISFAGALSNKQFDIIKQEVGNQPVFIATDNDAEGNRYKDKLIKLFPRATICQPESHKDWNDVLSHMDAD